MDNNNTLYLTGLRGLSAFGVFLIHSGGGGLRVFGDFANRIVDFGKYGVISFFVLSALTLSMSISRAQSFSYIHYLSRRFARIIPMYFSAILLFWSLGGQDYYMDMFNVAKHDMFDLIMHISFMNLWDVKYQNTIIGVEWTVPIEMWMYLIIPFLYFFLLNSNFFLRFALLILALFISFLNEVWYVNDLSKSWAVDSYLYCFIAGIVVSCYQGKKYFLLKPQIQSFY